MVSTVQGSVMTSESSRGGPTARTAVSVCTEHWDAILKCIDAQRSAMEADSPQDRLTKQAEAHELLKDILPIVDEYKAEPQTRSLGDDKPIVERRTTNASCIIIAVESKSLSTMNQQHVLEKIETSECPTRTLTGTLSLSPRIRKMPKDPLRRIAANKGTHDAMADAPHQTEFLPLTATDANRHSGLQLKPPTTTRNSPSFTCETSEPKKGLARIVKKVTHFRKQERKTTKTIKECERDSKKKKFRSTKLDEKSTTKAKSGRSRAQMDDDMSSLIKENTERGHVLSSSRRQRKESAQLSCSSSFSMTPASSVSISTPQYTSSPPMSAGFPSSASPSETKRKLLHFAEDDRPRKRINTARRTRRHKSMKTRSPSGAFVTDGERKTIDEIWRPQTDWTKLNVPRKEKGSAQLCDYEHNHNTRY